MALLDDKGNLLGVTGLRKIDYGTSNDWELESVTGWVVYGNKFVISMDGIEIALSAEAVANILSAIAAEANNRVTLVVEGVPV